MTIDHPRFGEVIVVKTRRARRVSLSVRPPAKIRLTLPVSCSMKEGLEFLSEKEEWIAKTLDKLAEKYPVRTIEPTYRTPMRRLCFVAEQVDEITVRISDEQISITHPSSLDYTSDEVQSAAREGITKALKIEAKQLLPPLVERIARENGFKYGRVTVRATRSRWGSCSADNNISLSIFLLCVPPHLCEYVILHELCHTKYKDHSPKFHKLLDELLEGKEKQYAQQLHQYRTDII